MSNNQISEFLSILETEKVKPLSVKVPSRKSEVFLEPLTFKQQKSLITTRLDGIVGVMTFIKTLNEILIQNTGDDTLKLQDRVPLALNLRKTLTDDVLKKNDLEFKLDDFLNKKIKFIVSDDCVIEGKGYSINLKIPTLKEESKIIGFCIDELKKTTDDKLGKNISLILSYEIPKFIDSIIFGEKVVNFNELSIFEKNKIIDNLPANIINEINKYIVQIRDFDEEYMTIDGITIEIDADFFE